MTPMQIKDHIECILAGAGMPDRIYPIVAYQNGMIFQVPECIPERLFDQIRLATGASKVAMRWAGCFFLLLETNLTDYFPCSECHILRE